ncbi:MAG: hypothetical protein M1823_001668 [Watsoniomyces obsoletus]|nr:MAG: hypothetical protein M1823_001668 [Watsoniomyces obsoletus]
MAEEGGNNNEAPSMPLFLFDQLQVFLVKGNYMTLAVKPKAVDLGEWIAHQVVEQHRTLTKFIDIVQAAEPGKAPLCNTATCPTMNAGNHTYTWLDSNRQPTRLAAYRYIELVQKWIKGKINDPNLFPTETDANAAIGMGQSTNNNHNQSLSTRDNREWIGKSSGFPDHFFQDCRNMYKQMFRVFAHIYWNHFEWPFFHADMERWLNSSFMLFVIVGTELELLTLKDLEPMQILLDKWYALEKFPTDCRYLVMVENSNGGGGGGGGWGHAGGGGHGGGQGGYGQLQNQGHGYGQGQGQGGGQSLQMQIGGQGGQGGGQGAMSSPGNPPLSGGGSAGGSGNGTGSGNPIGAIGTGMGGSGGGGGGGNSISPAPTPPPPPTAGGGIGGGVPPSNTI